MRSKSALTKACFNLRKFESNSTELDNLVKPERPGTEDDTKILGLTWNKLNDQFIFSFQHLLPLAVDIPTKRELKRIANVSYINDGKTMHILRPINRLYPIETVNELNRNDSVDNTKITFVDDSEVQIF